MTNNHHDNQFEFILSLIHEAKNRVYQNVNATQIILYWQIGGYIYERLSKAEWGRNTIQKLADFCSKKTRNLLISRKGDCIECNSSFKHIPINNLCRRYRHKLVGLIIWKF
jgi:DUF1016 N-terminal domain